MSLPSPIRRIRRLLPLAAVLIGLSCGSNAGPEVFEFSGSPKRDEAVENATDLLEGEIEIDSTTFQGVSFDTPIGPFDLVLFAGTDQLGRTVHCRVSGGGSWSSTSSCADPFSAESDTLMTRAAVQTDGWAAFEFTVGADVTRVAVQVADGTEYTIDPGFGSAVAAWPRKRGCPKLVQAFDGDTVIAELTEFEESRGSLMGAGDPLCLSSS